MTTPEDGVTEGVRAGFDETDAARLRKDTVTTSAAETAKSLPILHRTELQSCVPPIIVVYY